MMTVRSATAVLGLVLVGLAGCGGGNSNQPGVASLSGSSHGVTSTTLPKASLTKAGHDWAACMRAHGLNVPDPVIGADGKPAGGGLAIQASGSSAGAPPDQAMKACDPLLRAFTQGLGISPSTANNAEMLKMSRCMRANGVPNFPDPDPSSGGIKITAGNGMDPTSPTFQKAQQACSKFGPKGPKGSTSTGGGSSGNGLFISRGGR